MGQGLPKAETSVLVKRCRESAFRIGMAEMNGWRASMEDAHVIHATDTWGFFGVFDGHGGEQCSKFIAKRIQEELKSGGCPSDDASVKALALGLDREFLDSNQGSGSTGTFVIVEPPADGSGTAKYHLRVGNVGDSRILLGRSDGTIYPGPGTDSGLTTDHKPDLDSEKERIERCGGHVQSVMGVSRVNGDLAVSRAFGDAQHKETGGPGQEDHPVTADPEFNEFDCNPSDFLMLVCDGISEGSFPNPEVVKFAAEHMKKSKARDGHVDPAKAAIEVCHEAVRNGSKDNLSCMIVLLGGGEIPGKTDDFIPGPFAHDNQPFRKAYEASAQHAGLQLFEAVERRLSLVQKAIQTLQDGGEDADTVVCDLLGGKEWQLSSLEAEELEWKNVLEEDIIHAEEGSQNRLAAFEEWAKREVQQNPVGGSTNENMLGQLLQGQGVDPRLAGSILQGQGQFDDGSAVMVIVGQEDELKEAVNQHDALKWDDRLADSCGRIGYVIRDDPSDATMQVRFPTPLGFKAWLPAGMLFQVAGVQLAELDVIKQAMVGLPWDDEIANVAGKEGTVEQTDQQNGRVKVSFGESFTGWFPTKAVASYISDEGEYRTPKDDA